MPGVLGHSIGPSDAVVVAAGRVHVCKGAKAPVVSHTSHLPGPADMFRLVDGYREAPGTSGRLEVFYNGVWGTITGVSTGPA